MSESPYCLESAESALSMLMHAYRETQNPAFIPDLQAAYAHADPPNAAFYMQPDWTPDTRPDTEGG